MVRRDHAESLRALPGCGLSPSDPPKAQLMCLAPCPAQGHEAAIEEPSEARSGCTLSASKRHDKEMREGAFKQTREQSCEREKSKVI